MRLNNYFVGLGRWKDKKQFLAKNDLYAQNHRLCINDREKNKRWLEFY
jgi:hypothetical protein